MIVVHCSATRADCALTTEDLETIHRRRGFRGIGYHYYIRRDGTVVNTRALELVGAHAKGHNAHSIGICYEGGLDAHCLLYTSPGPRDKRQSRMPSSA